MSLRRRRAVRFPACTRQTWNRALFAGPERSSGALLAAPDYGAALGDVIARGLGLFNVNVRGRHVLLKPNLVEYEAGTMINTHPAVVVAAAEAFLRAGARQVVVGEGPGHRRDTEYLLTASGLSDCLRELRIPFVDLNVDDVRPVSLRSRFMSRDSLLLPVEVLRSGLVVSVVKLRTHHWAGMTASRKNLFGVVPGAV